MIRKRNQSPNPLLPGLPSVETATRNYIVNNRGTLRNTESIHQF